MKLAACLLIALTTVHAAEPAKDKAVVAKSAVPAWVEPMAWTVPTEPGPAGSPGEVLLSDAQDSLTPHGSDYYYHLVVRLISAEGVRENAEQTNEFSPDYETVTWHTLKVYRDGQVLDRLPTAEFKKLERELGLEAQTLTGQITLATVLDDIRVGDVLETAYTLHTDNPLFAGRINVRQSLGAAYPIRRQRILIHTPSAGPTVRSSFVVPPGTHGLPDALYRLADLRLAVTDETHGADRVLRWEATALPPVPFEAGIPSRAYPYWPQWRVSSFTAWADVVEWAEPLFRTGDKLPEPVATLVAGWKREPDPAKRLDAAVHWVQDDIRYFALAIGEHNLRPRPLPEICSSRYGDCKDKSVLLAAMLRALGFEAWPALANTYWRDGLRDFAPSPDAFNHAIVAYRYRDKLRWIDPTLKEQRGPAGEWGIPAYGAALILRPGEADLTPVDVPPLDEPDTVTLEKFTIDAATGDATVATEVTIDGLQADFYRASLSTETADERSRRWFNFIARFYPEMEEIDGPTVTDDPVQDHLILRAHYKIPGFVHTEQGRTGVATYAYAARALLDPPQSRRRHWPYALPSERYVRHRIEVTLPFDLTIEQQPEAIRSDGLDYHVERGVAGNRFVAQHDLRFTSDYVPAERMAKFSDAVEEVFGNFSTTLRRPPHAANPESKPAE